MPELTELEFQITQRSYGFYTYFQLHAEQVWVIHLEDDRHGDWLCVDPRNGRVPTFSSIPAARELLDTLGLTDRLITQLETAKMSLALRQRWPEPVNLDLIERWLPHPDGSTIDYNQFMRLWQLFEMLPPAVDVRLAPPAALSGAVYQHLWLGIYRPRVEAPIPAWSADELSVLSNTMRNGLESFRALTYSAT